MGENGNETLEFTNNEIKSKEEETHELCQISNVYTFKYELIGRNDELYTLVK